MTTEEPKEKSVDLVGRMNALFWSARSREYGKEFRTVHVDIEDFYRIVQIAMEAIPEDKGDIFEKIDGYIYTINHKDEEWSKLTYEQKKAIWASRDRAAKAKVSKLPGFKKGLKKLDIIYG